MSCGSVKNHVAAAARMWNAFPAAMSEFKYACPICGQHMKCASSQSGTVMECPTCFQKITAPQAPATDDPKFIITGTKVGERPIPAVVANAEALPAPAAEKNFPGLVVVFVVLFCVAAGVLFVFHGKIFKSTGGPDNQGTTATKVSFLATFKADLASPLAFEGPVPLTTTLPGNDRAVPGATGEIQYHGSFQGGLVIGVKLDGLVPNHKYILTLNGAIQHEGNNNLPEQVSRNNKQKYYDFSPVMTDENGRYQATFFCEGHN
jgi:DNA-directed RNA polymerase subunit RPC12/RpoP